MSNLKKSAFIWFIIAFVGSVLFVGGIPMIIFGAIKHITPIMILGIICTGLNFYFMPIAWIIYGGRKKYLRITQAVKEENIVTVQQLSQTLSTPENQMILDVKAMFEKGYMKGYLFDEQKITLNQNRKLEGNKVTIKCPNCGANVVVNENQQSVCSYCGTVVDDK